jgi:Protein of unknown function (DUF2914)
MKVFKLILASLMFFVTFTVYAEDGVSRSAITSAIEEKEPVDQVIELTNDKTKIFFFTEIRGMEGHTITHRWQHGDNVQADVKFEIGGNRWRVWSSKNLNESLLGEWTVLVMDAGENIMSQQVFNYIEAPASPVAAESEKPADTASESAVKE